MSVKRNIPLIYIISCLMWARFFIPVLALFYIASQVPLEQFTIIMSIFALTTLVLEVPSGIVADLLGKKKTLLISRAFYIIEVFMVAFYNGFWIFLIAKIISGIGVSLSSGTDDALLYDTLKKLKKEKEHKKISGIKFTITNISMAVVFIIGGFLFAINNKLPAIASLPLISLGFILTFFLEEPYVYGKKLGVINSFKHLKESLSYFWRHSYVKFLVFYSLPVFSIIQIMLPTSSAYFAAIKIPVFLIGILAFISSMIIAYSSKKAYALEERLGQKKSLIYIQIMSLIGVFLMALMIDYIGVLFYMIIPLTLGYFQVVINNYINQHIDTEHRATMISIKNLFNNFGVFLLFPLVGYLTEKESMGFAFLILGFISLVYIAGLAFYAKTLRISKVNSKI